MYSQAQLESFLGSNYEASAVPITFTYNYATAIFPFLVIIGIFFIIIFFQRKKEEKIALQAQSSNSSSRELSTYKAQAKEEKQQKQNVYNKYNFNVYMNQSYNKYGKKHTKTNYNSKRYSKNNTNVIDVEVC